MNSHYLTQTLLLDEDIDLWVVIGNNDAFKLWVNDELIESKQETRLWTPFNNYRIVHFKRGNNTISLKLIRNTDHLDFSIGLRRYEGEHFNAKRWFLDFQSQLEQ